MFEFNATLIIAMISFVVFMFIMNAIFYRPILNIIRKREEFVNQNYKSSEEMKNQADEIRNEYQTKLDTAKFKSQQDTAKDIEELQKKYSEQESEVREKAKIQIQNNAEIIETQKQKLCEEIDSDIIDDISSAILKKVM